MYHFLTHTDRLEDNWEHNLKGLVEVQRPGAYDNPMHSENPYFQMCTNCIRKVLKYWECSAVKLKIGFSNKALATQTKHWRRSAPSLSLRATQDLRGRWCQSFDERLSVPLEYRTAWGGVGGLVVGAGPAPAPDDTFPRLP